jgi:Cdc6-like AAA superfamily ATPase
MNINQIYSELVMREIRLRNSAKILKEHNSPTSKIIYDSIIKYCECVTDLYVSLVSENSDWIVSRLRSNPDNKRTFSSAATLLPFIPSINTSKIIDKASGKIILRNI